MVDIRLIRKHIRRLVEHKPGGHDHDQQSHAGDDEEELVLKKTRPASAAYGRGMDNTRTPGRYDVFFKGEHVGTIWARSRRQFEPAHWEFEPTKEKKNHLPGVPFERTREKLLASLKQRLLHPEEFKY